MAYHCPVCNKNFEHKHALTNHARTHPTGKTKRPCIHCGKLYAGRKALHRHVLEKHKGKKRAPVQKQYTCDECGKAYAHKVHLKLHKDAVHINKEKLWKCPYGSSCDKVFAYKSSLERHIREAEYHKYLTGCKRNQPKKEPAQPKTLIEREAARNAQLVGKTSAYT